MNIHRRNLSRSNLNHGEFPVDDGQLLGECEGVDSAAEGDGGGVAGAGRGGGGPVGAAGGGRSEQVDVAESVSAAGSGLGALVTQHVRYGREQKEAWGASYRYGWHW